MTILATEAVTVINEAPEPTVELTPGDILHVRLGMAAEDFGDGQPPWIPSPEELEEALARWEAVVPEGVKVIATHAWETAEFFPVADETVGGSE